MLAKEIKIKTILKQRAFIEKQLSKTSMREDGNPLYIYEGYVYLANVAHFRKEGYDVTRSKLDPAHVPCDFKHICFFTPKEEINLLDEELKEAEKYISHDDSGKDIIVPDNDDEIETF